MGLYTGIDIIETERIDKAVRRWGNRFLQRIYTEKETADFGNRTPSLAARFAAKEAVMKLLGKGLDRIEWREIEILSGPEGRPFVNLYGKAWIEASRLNLKDIAVSLSHSRSLAIASVSAITE